DKGANNASKLHDAVLVWVSQVHWLRVVGVHQGQETVHQIADVLERPHKTISYSYRDGFVLQSLQDKVADHSAIVHVHSRTECVENTSNSNFHIFLV
ncbi:hypothetical protein EGW08_008800, partial [Elysia chlorotica]